MIDELCKDTFRVVPSVRWWRNGWYHTLCGLYKRYKGCQKLRVEKYSIWLMNSVWILSGWYHQSDDEETGGIRHSVVCSKGTKDAKTLGRTNTPYDWWTGYGYFPGGTIAQMMKKRVVSHLARSAPKVQKMPNLQAIKALQMTNKVYVDTLLVVSSLRWWRNGSYHGLFLCLQAVSSSSEWWYHPEGIHTQFTNHMEPVSALRFWHPLYLTANYRMWDTTRFFIIWLMVPTGKYPCIVHQSYGVFFHPKVLASFVPLLQTTQCVIPPVSSSSG